MTRLGDLQRRWESGEFFGRCATLERQRKTLVVVPGLPVSVGCGGRVEILEALPPPELLLINPMAPLDLAVLLRAPGPHVPVLDPGGFDSQHEAEGELLPVVALQPLDGEREGPSELREKRPGS